MYDICEPLGGQEDCPSISKSSCSKYNTSPLQFVNLWKNLKECETIGTRHNHLKIAVTSPPTTETGTF